MKDGLTDKERTGIQSILKSWSKVKKVILFGSRAMGTFRAASDIDLALEGDDLTLADILKLKTQIAELNFPVDVDLILLNSIENKELKKHIETYGIIWRDKKEAFYTKYELSSISDIIEEIAMGPFGSNIKVSCFISSGIPVLNGSNVANLKLLDKGLRFVSLDKANSLGKANACRGDIVITHRGTLGQIVYIPFDSKFDRYIISQSQFRIRCNLQKALPEYVVYYFHTREGQHKLLSNKSQVGVPALGRPTTTFKKLSLPLPTIKQQKSILSILSSLDDKIELNTKINANLEAQAQALFKSWFVDFEPFQDGEFVDSELGRIPKGWRVGTLSELGKIIGGGTPPKAKKDEYYTDNGISWLTPKDISTQNLKFISKGSIDITTIGYQNSSAKIIPKGSVLFSSRAPIGYIAIAKNEMCTNQGFKSIIPQNAETGFIYYYLKNSTANIELQATGSTFKEASGSLMKSLKIIIANKRVLNDFESIVASIFAKQEKNEFENKISSSIRDTLLPKLMSGEIDVSGLKV